MHLLQFTQKSKHKNRDANMYIIILRMLHVTWMPSNSRHVAYDMNVEILTLFSCISGVPVRSLASAVLLFHSFDILRRHTTLGEINVALVLIYTQNQSDLLATHVDLEQICSRVSDVHAWHKKICST
jgi:hypothetical protein